MFKVSELPIHRTVLMLTILLFSTVVGCSLAGCNTTEGFGKDVEETGDAIEDAARDAKD